MDMFRRRPQPLLVRINGSLRNIKDTDVPVSASKQVVDESGLATTDVDYGRRVLGRCPFYEFKGCFKVRTIPADRVRGLLAIDILPMALCIHRLSVPILVNHKPIGNEAAAKNIRMEGDMCEGLRLHSRTTAASVS